MAKKDKRDKKASKQRRVEETEVAEAEVVVADAIAQAVPEPGGAGLCYGTPVRDEGRTVIPVARVGSGGGGVTARPVGWIEVDAAGSRYSAIDGGRGRLATAGVAAAAGLLGALLGILAGRRSR